MDTHAGFAWWWLPSLNLTNWIFRGSLKFNQNFIKAFNIEAARLNGWIQSAQEATEEFPEDSKIPAGEAGKFFKKNYLLICENISNLLESSI